MRRKHKPALTRPRDFDSFWKRATEELANVLPEVDCRPAAGMAKPDLPAADSLELDDVSFASFGRARVNGYLLRWRDESPRPLVVHSHGYGGKCDVEWSWAASGVNVLGFDVRGFGRSAAAVPEPSRWGYVLTGIESPESSVLRGAVCDYIRAMEVGKQLLDQRVGRAILHGGSFAGGLALMAQAVARCAELLIIAMPTFGWAEGRAFFVKSGSGAEIQRYLDERAEQTEDVMLVLRYFDPINFAPLVTCPTLVGVGLSDEVVPASTVYAIANHLGGPHEIAEFPVSHSDRPEEELWQQFEDRWLSLATGGVPDSFGHVKRG